MKPVGVYEVMGRLAYRGHTPGTVFSAALGRNAEARAVQRGNIRLLEVVGADLPEGKYRLPEGWA